VVHLIINIQITLYPTTTALAQAKHVGFVVDKGAVRFFSEDVGFPPSATIQTMLHLYSPIIWGWHSRAIDSCNTMGLHLYPPQELKTKS
jgi:hypothetical protein